MTDKLYCAILGDASIFSVDFNNTQTVEELQDAIKAKKKHALASYDASSLVLYKVNIDISNKEIYPGLMEQLRQSSINKGEMLAPPYALSEYWGESDLPKKKTINVLVHVSRGESIDSIEPRVWCVAETSPISSPFAMVTCE